MAGYCGSCNQHYREHYTVHAEECEGMQDFLMEMEDEKRNPKPFEISDIDTENLPF